MKKKQGIIILSAFFIIISTILLINKPSYAAVSPGTNYCPEEIFVKASTETLSLVPNITLPKNLNITNTSGTSLENTAITYSRDTTLADSKYVKSYEGVLDIIPTFTSNPTENRYYQQLFAWWVDDIWNEDDYNLTKEEKDTIKESENGKKLVEKIEEYQKYNDWTYSEDAYSTPLTLDEIDTSKITYTVTNDYIETSLITPDCTKGYSYLFTNYQVEVPSQVIVVDKNGKEQKEFARGEGFKLRIPISSIKNNQASFQATIIGKSTFDIWGEYYLEESSTHSTRGVVIYSSLILVNCGKQEELAEFEELSFNYTEEVGNLEIQVIDAETKENLIDAEIVIYDQAGNIVYRYKTTESKINVTLPVGTYTIKQIVTPPNYQARETTITLDVTKDQKAVAVLENVQLISVPNTLKTTTTITMIGIIVVLVGVAIILSIITKRKKLQKM